MSEKTMEDEIIEFNGFSEAKIEITAPMKLSAKMEMKNLTIVCGTNNTGKSLTNKLLWASTFFLNLKLIAHVAKIKDEKTDIEMFQFILDNTFTEQNLNGEVQYSARETLLKVSFYTVRFEIDNGKLTHLVVDFPKDAKPMGDVIYLSKEARDFTAIESYLKVKKLLGVTEVATWDDLEKLGEYNKIYDIISIESLLPKFNEAKPLLAMIKQMGGSDELLGGEDLVDIEFNKEKSELHYITGTNEKKRLSTMGAGTQSIILMLLSSVNV